MSGIAAVFHRDGAPVDRRVLRQMLVVAAHRGGDGAGMWADGCVGLGHLQFCTTPESRVEQQPLADEGGLLCLTFDGRIDNREEVRRLLAGGAVLRTDTDAELILRAYERWGERCPARIIGDYTIVIWDGRQRQLYCARDAVGVRPCYYYLDSDVCIVGSEIRQVCEHPAVRRTPNEAMVAEYLSGNGMTNDETLFCGISRLQPGHYLTVRAGAVTNGRYWDVDPDRSIRYRTDRDYAEHFASLFEEAVRCRLRSNGPVGAHLSGGLDSSSVVSMVQKMAHAGRVSPGEFATFSLVYPGRACDESGYIDDVVRMWQVPSYRFEPQETDAPTYAAQVARTLDFPDYPNQTNARALTVAARARGYRVLLTGDGGDDWFTGSLFQYADLLRSGDLMGFWREVRSSSVGITATAARQRIVQYGIMPLVPKTVRHGIKRARKHSVVEHWPYWITPSFAADVRLAERLTREPPGPRFPSLVQKDLYHGNLTRGRSLLAHEMRDRFGARYGVETRSPLNDRRIIEFALALPEEQRWRSGWTKVVLREAMRGVLPESVRLRRDKVEFSHHFAETFAQMGGTRVFADLGIARRGWVDQWEATDMYRRFAEHYQQNNPMYGIYVWPLWMIYGMELWYTTVFGDTPALRTSHLGRSAAVGRLPCFSSAG